MTAWHVERCGSSWGPRPGSARPTRCSKRRTGSASAARTSSSRLPWTTDAARRGRCWRGWKSYPRGACHTGAPNLRKWTLTPSSPGHPERRSWTSTPTPTSPGAATPNAGRTSTSCSTPESTSCPPLTSSIWRRWVTSSARSPTSTRRRRYRTTSSAGPIRSISSTSPPSCCGSAWATERSTPPRRSMRHSRTTSVWATSPRCGSWRCCGWPTVWTRASPSTGRSRVSRKAGRPGNGSWWA